MNIIKRLYWVAILLSAFLSCNSQQNTSPEINKKQINLMLHAVVPYNINTGYSLPNDTSDFKIVTYLNLYCDPCWEKITLWKSFIKENPEFSQVSFYIFIGATLDDFERENANSNFDFPVFLDINQRFRIVNQLGSDPNQLTFLCNKNNEVLFTGLPFSPEKKDRYLQIITAKNNPE